jgi:hypothetical protein
MTIGNSYFTWVTRVLMTLSIAGCSMMGGNSSSGQGAAKPIPYVQNCAEVSVGSPSRFACNGKTYTSFQLAKIREDEAKKYASGE